MEFVLWTVVMVFWFNLGKMSTEDKLQAQVQVSAPK